MAEENEVILIGMWASSYCKRVELALKLKRVPYEYVEEDLSNKSPLLIRYNPVHKKVPVLVHNGKPIAESFVIMEYIDETWKDGPKLLPDDPLDRARVRFWASFIQLLLESTGKVIMSYGEEQEKALGDVHGKLLALEEGMKTVIPQRIQAVKDGNLGFLDILMVATLGPYKIQEEVLGKQILSPEKNPLVLSWLTALNELSVVKEATPPRDKLIQILQFFRRNDLNLAAD